MSAALDPSPRPPRNFPRIILIGLRCSGKTTVARLLAARMGRNAIDLDDRALERLGRNSVSSVFQELGERAWRDAEAEALDEVLAGDFDILALGGGTPMIARVERTLREARERMGFRIIYLRARPDTLAARLIQQAGDRPPLTEYAPAEEMSEVFAARDARYNDLADLVIESDGHAPQEIADAILASLNA